MLQASNPTFCPQCQGKLFYLISGPHGEAIKTPCDSCPGGIGAHMDALEDWSLRVAQILQDVCDDAQVAVGKPDGTDQLPDIRALLDEHSQIMRGEVLS